ncbi:MAG: hypothetical protein C0605_05665 [Hyphomicrobiales bacterium]|nr:MAG: hypothetical protein C0605_05665 [Hyphomicrobiales bacterium]
MRQLFIFVFLVYAVVIVFRPVLVSFAYASDDALPAISGKISKIVSTSSGDINQPNVASRKALVIGIRNFDHLDEIPSGKLDAETFGRKLESLGFTIIYSIDEGSQAVWTKISDFERSVEPGDVALFYYSGHGFQHKGLNFMTARDTPKPIPADDLLDMTVPLDDIVNRLRKRKPGFSLILIDACRENTSMIQYPNGTSKSLGKEGFASIRTPPPHMVMGFATYFGKTAQSSNDPNKNSVYTRYLNRYIDRKDTEIIDILSRYVGQEVNAAQPGQVPETRVLPAGFFYPKRGALVDGIEKNSWNNALRANSYGDVQKFLWLWPVGRYAAKARSWLSENQKLKNVAASRKSIILSASIRWGNSGQSGSVRKLDPVGLNMDHSFINMGHSFDKPYLTALSRNGFANLARVERDFSAYAKPDAGSNPIASIIPGQSVRVTTPIKMDVNNPRNYFTEVEINPNSEYAKKVFIKDAFVVKTFWSPLWITVELKPMSNVDIAQDDVRVASITHRYIGKSDNKAFEIKAGVSLAKIKPYIESIYKMAGSQAPLDMRSVFAKVVLTQSTNEKHEKNTRNALLYLRSLQVSNFLRKIGLKRENVFVAEKLPEVGKEKAIQKHTDHIQIYLPSVN